jgi:hypothetical protein
VLVVVLATMAMLAATVEQRSQIQRLSRVIMKTRMLAVLAIVTDVVLQT